MAGIEYVLVVQGGLEGDVELAGDLVRVVFVHGFRCLVFERVNEFHCGLSSCSSFQARTVCTVPSGVRVLPVDEFVDDCGVFLAVDEVPVDEKKEAFYAP